MATDTNPRQNGLPQRSLWFGTAGAAAAWVALCCADVCINWRACTHQMDYGIPPAHPGARILIGVVGAAFFFIAMAAGAITYRNWRRLTHEKHVLNHHAVERPVFMAFFGMIVTATMGMGILWLSLTPIFLSICWRAR